MADALRVYVCQCSEKLVNIELHLEYWHCCLHFVEISRSAVNSLWDEFLDKIEVNLVLLLRISTDHFQDEKEAYTFAIRVVESLEFDNIWMSNDAHDLQLTVLWRRQLRAQKVSV